MQRQNSQGRTQARGPRPAQLGTGSWREMKFAPVLRSMFDPLQKQTMSHWEFPMVSVERLHPRRVHAVHQKSTQRTLHRSFTQQYEICGKEECWRFPPGRDHFLSGQVRTMPLVPCHVEGRGADVCDPLAVGLLGMDRSSDTSDKTSHHEFGTARRRGAPAARQHGPTAANRKHSRYGRTGFECALRLPSCIVLNGVEWCGMVDETDRSLSISTDMIHVVIRKSILGLCTGRGDRIAVARDRHAERIDRTCEEHGGAPSWAWCVDGWQPGSHVTAPVIVDSICISGTSFARACS